jgi:peptidoglycan biosynthesis protein MviN/MurJ (putative lipid II flippase)
VPVLWAIVAVALNVSLMLLLVGPMGVEGLALAVSISAVAEVLGLLWALRARLETLDEGALLTGLWRAALAGAAAAAVMLGGTVLLTDLFPGLQADGLGRLLGLLALLAAGAAAYVAVAALTGSPELGQRRGYLGGRRRRT